MADKKINTDLLLKYLNSKLKNVETELNIACEILDSLRSSGINPMNGVSQANFIFKEAKRSLSYLQDYSEMESNKKYYKLFMNLEKTIDRFERLETELIFFIQSN